MIVCSIQNAYRYIQSVPHLDEAIDYLLAYNPSDFEEGTTELDFGIKVKAEAPGMLPRERVFLEAHKRYIDVHVPLKTTETIGWASLDNLRLLKKPYDSAADVEFYGDQAQCMLHLQPGTIAIFFPDDAHGPNIGVGSHRKLCIKIPVK